MKYIDKTGAEIDISGLPDELVSELTCGPDQLESQIIEIMPKDGSAISLDMILVRLYKSFGVMKKRRFMQNKLYRTKEIVNPDGQAGIYQLHPALIEGAGHD